MAFTTPATRATDFLVTAAIWNAELVDNMNTAWPHLVVRKPSDESVVSSTALQDDNDLLFAVGANEIWLFNILLIAIPNVGAIKSSFSFPASGDLQSMRIGFDTALTSAVDMIRLTASDGTTYNYGNYTTSRIWRLENLYINAGTAGNVVFRWAQNASNGTASVVKANSTLWAVKLA